MFPKKSSLIYRADRNDNQHHRYRHIAYIANTALYLLALAGFTLYLLWRAWQMNSLSTWLYFYLLAFGLMTVAVAFAQAPIKGRINVNNTLISAFVDAAHLLPTQHMLGLYAEGEMPNATYSDIKIYPLTPHAFWAYV